MIERDKITLSQVRVRFDRLSADYPDLKHHLDCNSNFIHSKAFENTIVKIQTGSDYLLSVEEKEILTTFQENSDDEVVEATELHKDFAETLLAAIRKSHLGILKPELMIEGRWMNNKDD